MFSSIRNTIIGISLTLAATSATALPITFDFSGSGNRLLGYARTFSESGLDVRVNAQVHRSWRGMLTQTHAGLGVTHPLDTSWQLDGFGPDEGILFRFSRSVRLLGFTLSGVGYNDDFTLSVDNTRRIAGDIPGAGSIDLSSRLGFDGTDFRFGVLGWNDDYFINSLTVDTTDVPEPGTIALFAVGLVGLGFARRRAKQ